MKRYIYLTSVGVIEGESQEPNYLLQAMLSNVIVFEKVEGIQDCFQEIFGQDIGKEFSLQRIFELYYNVFIKPRFVNQFNIF